MNRKSFVLGAVFGAVMIFSIYPILVEAADYYGKFPPTPAWSKIIVNDKVNNLGENMTANQYNRELFIVTDGSIEINTCLSSGEPC